MNSETTATQLKEIIESKMTQVTIRNSFTGRSITVDANRPLTVRKIKGWRAKLHNAGCTSGDDLGGSGKQDDPGVYALLLDRARKVICSGQNE